MTECGACGSPLPSDVQHCPACGAGVAQADELRSMAALGPIALTDPADSGAGGRESPGGDGAATAVAATAGRSGVVDPVTGLTDPDVGTGAGPGRRPHRWPALVLVMAGLILIAAGAYTTYRGAHGPRPGLPPGVAPSPTVRPTAQAQGHPTAQGGATATPDATSGTSSAGHGTPLVTVAPALLGQPGVADVVGTLTTYFTAINDRDYQDYRSVLVGADARVGGEQDFLTRFRSTTDSQIWVVGMRRDQQGELFATVTFRSHQDPRDSPDLVSDCLSWVVTYPMIRVDGAVRIDLVRNFALTHRPC